MDEFFDEIPKHKKKSKKKPPKKTNHKHEYEIVKKEKWPVKGLYTYIERCKICNKEKSRLILDE